MEASGPKRILVVADRAAATPALLAAIHARAEAGPSKFRVIVPNPAPAEWHPLHPKRHEQAAEAERELAIALPAIEAAAGDSVIGSVSIRHDPMDAVEQTLHDEPFDEIIVAHTPYRLERWLHQELAGRIEHLGLPVTAVDQGSEA